MQESLGMCDAIVSIDADLQDDEMAIIDMARQFAEGKDIVYGVRKQRKTDTWFKRFTAQAFYRLMQTADKEIIYNHADFRLMSERAVRALMEYPERNMFLRGMVRQLGFSEGSSIMTVRHVRQASRNTRSAKCLPSPLTASRRSLRRH